ncbi:hypothetical protein ELG79_22100 [Rhizobium leguminosarum]|uniref:hypothetical protein n=1 Tax=Rhizobium leguminosarum TaxID=384 RepID=UPI001030281F|nr:hypothetical protein [Rhizobium leguminosarum]TBG27782.1 hypothetical protein ELG79_22100 [Rhizobium leguminosarum]
MLLIIGVAGVIFGGACAIVASNKHRDVLGWFVLGFVFNLIALIVVAALSPLEREQMLEDAGDKLRPDEAVLDKDELRKKAADLAASLAQSRKRLSS